MNRRLLTGHFTLSSDGKLLGSLQETSWGHTAAMEREDLQGDTHDGWMRRAENWIAGSLPGVTVRKISVSGLTDQATLSQSHEIEAPYFAQAAGDLLLFRPSLLRLRLPWPAPRETRTYPFQFGYLRTSGTHFEFELPRDFALETLPQPVELATPFASYRQKVSLQGNILASSAVLEIKTLALPPEQVQELRDFLRRVQQADSTLVVLKRLAPPPAPPTP